MAERAIFGSLSETYRTCGQPGCRCSEGRISALKRRQLPRRLLGKVLLDFASTLTTLLVQVVVWEVRGNVRYYRWTFFVAFGWWTAMRKGEIAELTWEAFDHEAWILALYAKDAKARKGRVLALEGPLRQVIERRLQRGRLDLGLIFHRDGRPVVEFRKARTTACKRAGLSGTLFHDPRRSAIRNMLRAGVDPTVAMRISGHRADGTFRRYNITTEDDMRSAMAKTAEHVSTLPTNRKITAMSKARPGGAA